MASYAAGFERGLDRGEYGPRHALPALAQFARSGDPRLAQGIKETLRHYGDWVDREIAAKGGVFSLEGATLLAIHARELRIRGQFTAADERWLKDTMLKLRRYGYGNRPGEKPLRGFQHRAAMQGTNNILAAFMYPDERDAPTWRAYGEQVWSDWWAYRDIGINDISYFSSSLAIFLATADLLGRSEVFDDARARSILWERLVQETTPDGALVPYGASAGWHGLAGVRIWALELAARHTGDGRYRYVAARLMNYGQQRGFSPSQQHYHAQSIEGIALAAIACDDRIEAVPPSSQSVVLSRPEVERLSPAQIQLRFPSAGGVDAEMYMTGRVLPSKLVFRSGWEPGDLYMLMEAYPRHDPLNPTAVLALERWSSSFTEMASEKYLSRENAVRIDDLSGTASFAGAERGNWPAELPLGYAGMEVSVEAFGDTPLASHGRLLVKNYMGFRADHTRDVLFVKDRFVLLRDETLFADRFRAGVGPVWNTQQIVSRGANWADTSMTAHWTQDYRLYDNPRWNLLTFYAPRTGAALQQSGARLPRVNQDQAGALGRMQVTQYKWEGPVAPGDRLQFVSLLLPHTPALAGSDLARSIGVLRDEPGIAALAVSSPETWELAVLNKDGRLTSFDTVQGEVESDAYALYVAVGHDGCVTFSTLGSTVLRVAGNVPQQRQNRADLSSVDCSRLAHPPADQ